MNHATSRAPVASMRRRRIATTVVASGFALALPQCGSDEAASVTPPAAAAGALVPIPTTAPTPVLLGDRLHVIVSGSMLGRLEPCGCASGQLGGLPRRRVYISEVHGADLLLEGGNLVAGHNPLDLEKGITAMSVLLTMEPAYDAVGLGPNDLMLPLDQWGGFLANFDRVVATDLLAEGTPLQPRAFVEKNVRGMKVRVLSLTMQLPATATPSTPAAPPLRLLEPAAAWQRGLEGATPETLRVVMVHATPDKVRALGRSLQPPPDLMVGVDDSFHEPPGQPELVGTVPLVFPGIRGRFLIDLLVGRTAQGASLPRYELVPLRGSETKPDAGQDPATKSMLRDHRMWVADNKVLEAMAGQAPTSNGASYVGSKRCGECHELDWQLWSNSKHGRAWDTLVRAEADPKRYGWPVTKYPDCVGCHVVGYGHQSGFVNMATTPELADVGCEQCHGPGSEHSKAPRENRLGKVGNGTPSATCATCHDFEQSPDFDYVQRWGRIEHGKRMK